MAMVMMMAMVTAMAMVAAARGESLGLRGLTPDSAREEIAPGCRFAPGCRPNLHGWHRWYVGTSQVALGSPINGGIVYVSLL